MIRYFPELIQGSDKWLQMRCGLLTASEMKLIITPKALCYSKNDKEKQHLYELAAQRVTKYVEPMYVSDDMLRGKDDEIEARELYSKHYSPVQEVGFVTNDKWGFTLGYSPDGLVGDDGLIEVKGRRQKHHMETIIIGVVPDDFIIQVQTALLVSERQWLDYISYCGGMPMKVIRVVPDEKIHAAIIDVAKIFHQKLDSILAEYESKIEGLHPTERRIVEEIAL